MNERIVKLFMQSVDTNYIPLPIEAHIPLWTEKFAELIVRECAMFVVTELEGKVGSLIADTTANRLEQHFGVQE